MIQIISANIMIILITFVMTYVMVDESNGEYLSNIGDGPNERKKGGASLHHLFVPYGKLFAITFMQLTKINFVISFLSTLFDFGFQNIEILSVRVSNKLLKV